MKKSSSVNDCLPSCARTVRGALPHPARSVTDSARRAARGTGMGCGIVPYAVPLPMTRLPRRALILALVAVPALALGACGSEEVSVPKTDASVYRGAELFHARCGACHTLDVAGTQGSATNVRTRENKDGPNFNQRKEDVNDVLYAIRNGGFSSGPMPQDILVGQDAEDVAKFVAKYSGKQADEATQGQQGGPTQTNSGG